MIPLLFGIAVFVRIFGRALRDPAFRGLAISVLLVLAAGTAFYPLIEGWSVLDSLYFSVITLTTVGFGDFAPETAVGKIFTILYIFVGLGFIMAFVTTIVQKSPLWTLELGEGGSEAQGRAPSEGESDRDSQKAHH